MTKAQYKKAIANTYGFAATKITLLEAGDSYVMFEVCGITYQADLTAKTLTIF